MATITRCDDCGKEYGGKEYERNNDEITIDADKTESGAFVKIKWTTWKDLCDRCFLKEAREAIEKELVAMGDGADGHA